MNILVTNIYSWRNKGDAAIVIALLGHLEKEFPGAGISLSSHDVDDKGRYGPYPCCSTFLTLLRQPDGRNRETVWRRLRFAARALLLRIGLACFSLLRKLRIPSYGLFPADFAAKLRTYETADLVVACGGGYLLSTHGPRKLERLLGYDHLWAIRLDFHAARLFSKPFILHNQSVGPFFSRRDTRRTARCLKDAALVICREALTYDRLRAMGLKNIELAADAAFGLKPMACGILERYGFSAGHTHIGLTVRRCLPAGMQSHFESEIARFIERIIAMRPDVRFYFMPQVIYTEAGDDDREVAERVQGLLSAQSRPHVAAVTEDLHPGALKHLIGQMDYFVGTRMHSNIFALSSLVKTLAIAYEPKTIGIMRMLGLESYVTAAEGLDHTRLVELWERLSADSEYLTVLGRKLPEIQRAAEVDLRRPQIGIPENRLPPGPADRNAA